jgi:competence protein ComEC
MMSIVLAGWALQRPSDLLNSLAAASLIILGWDPLQLFQASFQLSFFVVLSIAVFVPPLDRLRQRLVQTDPYLPTDLLPKWRRVFESPLRYLTRSLATSLAAWLGSVPLVAYYFHLVTPVSLLANLIIVPLSGFALMSCLGSIVCGGWISPVTNIFNHSGWFWMAAMVQVSSWAANLPGAFFYVKAPAWWEFALYYAALIGCLSGWFFAPGRRMWSLIAAIVGVMGWAGHHWYEAGRVVRITIPPLGGSAIFVDHPRTTNDFLIDSGSESSVQFLGGPMLHAQGVERLPMLLLTHGDLQHVGGFEVLQRQFAVDRIVTSGLAFRSSAYRKIMTELSRTPNRWRTVHRGDRIANWRVMHPAQTDRFRQADDGAIVLKTEVYGVGILLLSDLGRAGQQTLMERESTLRADVVVAGVPTSGEPLYPWLLDALQPRLIIIASAEYPAGSQGNRALRSRLSSVGIPVIFTADTGAAVIELRPKSWEVRTPNGFRFRERTGITAR